MIAPPLGNTQEAICYGVGLRDGVANLAMELQVTRAQFRRLDETADPSSIEDLEHMIAVGFRLQMLSEALQAATRTGAIGELLAQ